jgi:hypothetical protein
MLNAEVSYSRRVTENKLAKIVTMNVRRNADNVCLIFCIYSRVCSALVVIGLSTLCFYLRRICFGIFMWWRKLIFGHKLTRFCQSLGYQNSQLSILKCNSIETQILSKPYELICCWHHQIHITFCYNWIVWCRKDAYIKNRLHLCISVTVSFSKISLIFQ